MKYKLIRFNHYLIVSVVLYLIVFNLYSFDNGYLDLPVWIKQGLKLVEEPKSQLNTTNIYGLLLEVSFGHQVSTTIYSWSKSIQNYNLLQWKTDIRHKYLAII